MKKYALCFLVLLVGCGGGDDSSSQKPVEPPVVEPSPPTEPEILPPEGGLPPLPPIPPEICDDCEAIQPPLPDLPLLLPPSGGLPIEPPVDPEPCADCGDPSEPVEPEIPLIIDKDIQLCDKDVRYRKVEDLVSIYENDALSVPCGSGSTPLFEYNINNDFIRLILEYRYTGGPYPNKFLYLTEFDDAGRYPEIHIRYMYKRNFGSGGDVPPFYLDNISLYKYISETGLYEYYLGDVYSINGDIVSISWELKNDESSVPYSYNDAIDSVQFTIDGLSN
ncbi:hypothetical protein [Vibrio superstes]|uniref:Lipoprotein n=1 Tax=Vibrio superstes NBRC 103154 TaxID=1219062 RepID=A0A511QQW7_9VIBR|nr:hypothetical protein [Vibrio superstes]GEM79457.1 hypothetical protein VSU01S_17020 [Vibrio superstes NBRC 103154]